MMPDVVFLSIFSSLISSNHIKHRRALSPDGEVSEHFDYLTLLNRGIFLKSYKKIKKKRPMNRGVSPKKGLLDLKRVVTKSKASKNNGMLDDKDLVR